MRMDRPQSFRFYLDCGVVDLNLFPKHEIAGMPLGTGLT